jgi:hypothetical protein
MQDASLHPDFPVVEGPYTLAPGWSAVLPARLNRRIEEGQLVLWRPQLTFWMTLWGNDRGASCDARLASILETASPVREKQTIEREPDLLRLTYELTEQDAQRHPSEYRSVSGYVISPAGHLQVAAYCDTDSATALAYRFMSSVRATA